MVNNNPIANLAPHYTNTYYNKARTVWIADGYTVKQNDLSATVDGAEYNYSDRIWQWDYQKADKAWGDTKAAGLTPSSSAFLQHWLRLYFDNPTLELVHVLAGVNLGNGYPYQVYGYITHQERDNG